MKTEIIMNNHPPTHIIEHLQWAKADEHTSANWSELVCRCSGSCIYFSSTNIVSKSSHWSGSPFPSPMHACMLSCFSHVWLCATPWTAAHQAPPSTGFSRQEYWSGVPFSSPKLHIRQPDTLKEANPKYFWIQKGLWGISGAGQKQSFFYYMPQCSILLQWQKYPLHIHLTVSDFFFSCICSWY